MVKYKFDSKQVNYKQARLKGNIKAPVKLDLQISQHCKHVGWAVDQLVKSHMKKCFSQATKAVKCTTFTKHPTCWLGECFMLECIKHTIISM